MDKADSSFMTTTLTLIKLKSGLSPLAHIFYVHRMLVLVHCEHKSKASDNDYTEKILFCCWKLALSNCIPVSVVVSIATKRRRYFWSSPDTLTFVYFHINVLSKGFRKNCFLYLLRFLFITLSFLNNIFWLNNWLINWQVLSNYL